jgi:porphobilinogen synthase
MAWRQVRQRFTAPSRDAVGSSGNLGGADKGLPDGPGNTDEALPVALNGRGTDMVMVKPTACPTWTLVPPRVKDESFKVPTFAWVSSEYAMLKAAAINGWLDRRRDDGEPARLQTRGVRTAC